MIDRLPDNNRHALRLVMRACRKATLATLMDGEPYASLVTVALDHDMAPVLLLSGLADHTRNLRADPRLSLLFDGTDGHPNPQTGPRVTLTGRAAPTDDRRLADRFLARHPGAAEYSGFGDFGFWRVEPLRAHFVGGFGRAVWFDAPFGLSPAAIRSFSEAPFAPRPLAKGWTAVAIDPDGCDIRREDAIERRAFPTPLDSTFQVETALFRLAEEIDG